MDKEKIYQALKQAYYPLGLGDTILQSLAESLAATGLVTDENLSTVIAAQKKTLEGIQKGNDKRVADAVAKAKTEQSQKTINELLASVKTMKDGYDALKTENDKFKAEKALSERKSSIISKAKELGIPQWRIDEGFVIADDADDNAITAHLTTVSNNVKAQMLPGDRHSFPLSDNKPDKEAVKAIAKSMVK